jgi:hypothetical protein
MILPGSLWFKTEVSTTVGVCVAWIHDVPETAKMVPFSDLAFRRQQLRVASGGPYST